MPIIIAEGADGVGKTTLCMKYLDQIYDSIYVHFPIRDLKTDVISYNIPSKYYEFSLCESLKQKSMQDTQDIILLNIITNSYEIMKLHDMGFTIITDRYICSNIIYRQLYNLSLKSVKPLPTIISRVLNVSNLNILTEKPKILYQRIQLRNGETVVDEIDEINEKKDNIKLANKLFSELNLDEFV